MLRIDIVQVFLMFHHFTVLNLCNWIDCSSHLVQTLFILFIMVFLLLQIGFLASIFWSGSCCCNGLDQVLKFHVLLFHQRGISFIFVEIPFNRFNLLLGALQICQIIYLSCNLEFSSGISLGCLWKEAGLSWKKVAVQRVGCWGSLFITHFIWLYGFVQPIYTLLFNVIFDICGRQLFLRRLFLDQMAIIQVLILRFHSLSFQLFGVETLLLDFSLLLVDHLSCQESIAPSRLRLNRLIISAIFLSFCCWIKFQILRLF